MAEEAGDKLGDMGWPNLLSEMMLQRMDWWIDNSCDTDELSRLIPIANVTACNPKDILNSTRLHK